jgi:hypothetical protein
MTMPTSSSGYGVYSPQAIDPFPIETDLAKIIASNNNPDNAMNLLGQYHTERLTSEGNYNQMMQGQHDYARQQLAATIHENNVKALQEGFKTPGLLDAYNSPQYGDITAGINPDVLQRGSTNLRSMQLAEQLQKGGAGLESTTNAGFQPDSAQASVATGGLAGPQGQPVSTQNAIIAANARLAAARTAAAATGQPSRTVRVINKYGQIENVSFSSKNASDENMDRFYKEHNMRPIYEDGTGKALPSEAQALTPQGRAAAAQSTGGSPNTSAAPATPATQGQRTVRPNNAAAGKRDFQTFVLNNIESPQYQGTPEYKVVKDGMAKNNGLPFVAQDRTGKWVVANPATGRPFNE